MAEFLSILVREFLTIIQNPDAIKKKIDTFFLNKNLKMFAFQTSKETHGYLAKYFLLTLQIQNCILNLVCKDLLNENENKISDRKWITDLKDQNVYQ